MEINDSDFLKLKDAIDAAAEFMAARDRMNAAGHLAKEVRYAPLTSMLLSAQDRAGQLVAQVEGFNQSGT